MRTTTAPFVVPVTVPDATGLPVERWLAPDLKLVDDVAAAVRFRFYLSPRMQDATRIERATHDLAGGLREFLDLQRGCESARLAALADIEAGIWPTGRPKAATDEERGEQDKRMQAAWASSESLTLDGYRVMRQMLDRLQFLASWPVLIVDAPKGWESIADMELDTGIFFAVWNAWTKATAAAREGKS